MYTFITILLSFPQEQDKWAATFSNIVSNAINLAVLTTENPNGCVQVVQLKLHTTITFSYYMLILCKVGLNKLYYEADVCRTSYVLTSCQASTDVLCKTLEADRFQHLDRS